MTVGTKEMGSKYSRTGKYGSVALIAGGSEGIGQSFAMQLAAQGLDLILLARREEPLKATADQIRTRFGVEVTTHAVDLTSADLMPRVDALVADREVGLLVYNAGAIHGAGLMHDRPLEDALALIRLNCIGPLTLVHVLGGRMRERGRGGIILMSSMSAFGGVGNTAVYSATKAFDRILAEGLWWELGAFGVDVLGLIAGATATPAMARSNAQFALARAATGHPGVEEKGIQPMNPDDVACEALEQLGHGPVWIAGAVNRAIAEQLHNAPREAVIVRLSETSAQLYGLELPGSYRR